MDIFSKTDFILVIIVFLGLLTQRKRVEEIVSCIVKALIGYYLINLGSQIAVSTLGILSLIIRRSLHVFDIIPNNETMISIIQNDNGNNTLYIMIIAMGVNIVIARFTKIKFVFLNGFYIFYMAGMLALLINNEPSLMYILFAGIYLGFFMSILPFITHPFIKKISNRDDIGLGHFGSFACVIGGISALVFRRRGNIDDEKSKKVSFIRDSNVLMAISMFLIFLFATFNVDKSFLYDFTGEKNRLYIAFKYGLNFTVSFYLIILGVRMMLDEILYSFKGIAEKIIPNSKPALDVAVFFPYNPEIVLLGFIFSIIGGVIAFIFEIKVGVPVVLPAITAHLFSGGTAGLFGYSVGKKRGAILSSFIHGLLISIIPIILLPILKPHIGLMRTCYADSDFGILAIIFNFLMKIFMF